MKKAFHFAILLSVAMPIQVSAQNAPIFPRGEKAPAIHHTGDVWLNELNHPDSNFNYSIAVASFAAGARLDWHIHPAGQILLMTEGAGFYQEKGKPKQTVHKGDVVKCLPGVEHWHGATPESSFAYLATTPAQKGRTIWLHKVTDEEYYGKNRPAVNNRNMEQEIIELSKQKWLWMADKNADTLAYLFHEKSVFVHMGGAWGKDRELEIIQSGGIHYKKADIHEVSVNIMDNTAVLLNKITLLAVVGGNEVTNPFMVTEVYLQQGGKWVLASLSFTKLLN